MNFDSFHDIRHTHATILLKGGVHPKIVSERLGHANNGITLDTYNHVLSGLQKRMVARSSDLASRGR
jgi:integrase